MAITLSELQSASTRIQLTKVAKSVSEARATQQQTAFLCHSHKDEALAKGLQVILAEHGWKIYIDWQDCDMPATPNQETATRIKDKITRLDWFLFLATPNSTASRWCPWEIGYADSVKKNEKILIVPTEDRGQYYGNEYLQLYRKVTTAKGDKLAAFMAGAGTGGVLVEDL